MTHILEAVADVTGCRDRDVMDASIAQVLQDALALSVVRLFRIVGDGDQQEIVQRASADCAEAQVESDLDLAWETVEVAELRQACVDTGKVVRSMSPAGHLTLFPLTNDRNVVGFVEVETPLPLADQAEKLVAGMLRIYRNHLDVLEYSERDTLTGLLNRKTFEVVFARALSTMNDLGATGDADRRRQPSEGLSYWLGVLDIDHFKAINDRHGHLIGDEVLLLLARLLRETFRSSDRLFRFGGEEFVAIVEAANTTDATTAFERLRRSIEVYAFPQVGRVTASIGFTMITTGDGPTAAFARADHAVYFAKQNGRNQTHAYEQLIASGALAATTVQTGDVELF